MKMTDFRKDFPLIANSKIAYLDSGATAQKPFAVLECMKNFYEKTNANPHRGVYKLSVDATNEYVAARQTVADFIGAKSMDEIVFTKNATESLNLLAYSYGLDNISEGDEIVLSIMEHHSNLVPWQMVAKKKHATLKYLYINKNCQIDESELEKITNKTKIVSITALSNVLGTKVDLDKIIKKAHAVGAKVIIDACQAVAHMPINVSDIDADFAVFSGHKIYAPLGIGVLYGKKELLEKMSPFMFGGDMIEYVYENDTTFAPVPTKFEAGTQNVAGAVGLAAAIKYLQNIGYEKICKHEQQLLEYAITNLKKLPYIDLYCPNDIEKMAGVISFNMKGVHPHDVSSLLDGEGVCVRSGNHCAQPLLRFMGLDSTCRASISIYSNKDDIDKLIEALKKIYEKFKKYIG